MSLAGAQRGSRPNSSAPSDGGSGNGSAWQAESVSHIERRPRSFGWQPCSTLMQERESLSAAKLYREEVRERASGKKRTEKTRSRAI